VADCFRQRHRWRPPPPRHMRQRLISTPIRMSQPAFDHTQAVPVTDAFSLDAGPLRVLRGDQRSQRRPVALGIRPELPMLRQLFGHLKSTMAAQRRTLSPDDEGRALALLCVRWGSYFAVLADQTKPLMPESTDPDPRRFSRVANDEMHRMNVEISANLCALMTLRMVNPVEYAALLSAALQYLPAGFGTTPSNLPEAHSVISLTLDPEWPGPVPPLDVPPESRVRAVANGLTIFGWRNGEIENIHAGHGCAYPVGECRITAAESHAILVQAAAQFSHVARAPELGPLDGALWGAAAARSIEHASGWTLRESGYETRVVAVVEDTVYEGAVTRRA
jgi:hypothetical protein